MKEQGVFTDRVCASSRWSAAGSMTGGAVEALPFGLGHSGPPASLRDAMRCGCAVTCGGGGTRTVRSTAAPATASGGRERSRATRSHAVPALDVAVARTVAVAGQISGEHR